MDARILVVEDIPALRRLAVQALEHVGCAAIGVGSLAEALEVAAVSAPDVLVLDERIVRAAPDDLLALKRSSGPLRDSKIVALGKVATRSALMAMGADCVVGKPFTDRDLVVGVEWVMGVYADGVSGGPAAQARRA